MTNPCYNIVAYETVRNFVLGSSAKSAPSSGIVLRPKPLATSRPFSVAWISAGVSYVQRPLPVILFCFLIPISMFTILLSRAPVGPSRVQTRDSGRARAMLGLGPPAAKCEAGRWKGDILWGSLSVCCYLLDHKNMYIYKIVELRSPQPPLSTSPFIYSPTQLPIWHRLTSSASLIWSPGALFTFAMERPMSPCPSKSASSLRNSATILQRRSRYVYCSFFSHRLRFV